MISRCRHLVSIASTSQGKSQPDLNKSDGAFRLPHASFPVDPLPSQTQWCFHRLISFRGCPSSNWNKKKKSSRLRGFLILEPIWFRWNPMFCKDGSFLTISDNELSTTTWQLFAEYISDGCPNRMEVHWMQWMSICDNSTLPVFDSREGNDRGYIGII